MPKREDLHKTIRRGQHALPNQLAFRTNSVEAIEGLLKFYLRSEQASNSGKENRRTAIITDILTSMNNFEHRFDTNPQHQFIIKEIQTALEKNDTAKLKDLLERHTCNLKIRPTE